MSAPNYRVLVSFDRDRNVFLAHTPELEHCAGEGPTRAEAITRLEEEIQAQVQNMRGGGLQPPVPVDEENFSGEIALKVSRQMHRDLMWQARTEGVDLEHLLSELLASSLEQRRGGRTGRGRASQGDHDGQSNGGGRRSGYGNARYNANLFEDRANFIEYVRNLEHGGGGGGHHAAPGNNNNRRRNRGRGRGPHGGGQGPNGNGKP